MDNHSSLRMNRSLMFLDQSTKPTGLTPPADAGSHLIGKSIVPRRSDCSMKVLLSPGFHISRPEDSSLGEGEAEEPPQFKADEIVLQPAACPIPKPDSNRPSIVLDDSVEGIFKEVARCIRK